VTLPSGSPGYFFPNNKIAIFRTKLATPIELEAGKWEAGLVEISYPKGYRRRIQYNKLRYDPTVNQFHVKHYESLYDLVINRPQFQESSKRETFMKIFSEYLHKYMPPDEPSKKLLNT
jgi:hypothetical protein